MDFDAKKYTFISMACERLFGYTNEETLDITVDMVYLPGEFEKITNNIINPKIEEYYKTNVLPYIQYETQQYCKDGTLV
jgi:hypothetical protein